MAGNNPKIKGKTAIADLRLWVYSCRMDVVYVYEGPGTLPIRNQLADLAKAGIDVSDALEDRGDNRDELGNLLGLNDNPPLLSDEHVLRLACHAYLAKQGRGRAAILRKLTALGVRVAVLGEEPILYDNEQKIRAFNEIAASGAQSEAGKATRGAGPGRPGKLWPTREQFRYLLRNWRDDRVAARAVFDAVEDFTAENGFPRPKATWDDMRGMFGNRGDRGDYPPPDRLKAEYPKQQ